MAGLYIHIPFCKQKCHYCNFFSLASTKYKTQFVDALSKEIELQKNYLQGESLTSIYFGGGTPSLLNENELHSLFDKIHSTFTIETNAEITFEANPDDLSKSYLKILSNSLVNRLSIGIQSFNDNELIYLNRLHTSQEAIRAIQNAQDLGISSISLDLIYGIPIATNESWLRNLNQFKALDVNHLSAYNLTREENTAYDNFIKKGKYSAPDDVQGEEHYQLLLNFAKESGLEQYEVSNFAFDKKYAVHNTNYWKREKYLGIGPSAHSFNLINRSWNIAQLNAYIKSINSGLLPNETEILTVIDKWNELIMTGLRTKWGIDLNYLEENFELAWIQDFKKNAQKHIENGKMVQNKNHFHLTENGLFFADGIASDLFHT